MSKTTNRIIEEDEFVSEAINVKNLRYYEIIQAFQHEFETSEEEAERRVDLAIERNEW
jgi:hypothetical protein